MKPEPTHILAASSLTLESHEEVKELDSWTSEMMLDWLKKARGGQKVRFFPADLRSRSRFLVKKEADVIGGIVT